MAQEQQKLLDECDLDEHERESDRGEVGGDAQSRPSCFLTLAPTACGEPQRQQDQHEARDNRLNQRRDQHRVAPFEQRQAALLLQRQQFRQRAPFEKMEEVRLVVRRRNDVELVAIEERLSFGAEQRCRAVVEITLWQYVVAVGFGSFDAGVVRYVEGAGAAEILQRRNVRRRERTVLHDERRGLPAADQRQLQLRSRDAAFFQRRDRGGNTLEDIPGWQIYPARDREQAAGVEMAHVFVESLDGVKIA